MSVRQYIGARYVTKVYENTLDPSSAEWQASVNYEPLTMVTYNNGSYLSKKQVPASVGNPADNPTYWVQTGFYNGQILTLQNEVDDLQAQIDDINEKNWIIISDSYGTSYPDPDSNPTFFDYMRSYSGMDSDHLRGFGYSGSGFVHNNGQGTFLSRFTTSSASITDKEKVNTILVAAGRNDWDATSADIITAMQAFVTYCRTNYPNAKLLLAFIANGTNDAAYGTRNQQIAVYNEFRYATLWGFDGYLAGSECILKNTNYMAADGMHPSDNGKKALAFYLLQGLNTGYINVSYRLENGTITGVSGVSFTNGCQTIESFIENNIAYHQGYLELGAINFTYNTLVLNTTGIIEMKIGTISDRYLANPSKHVYLPYSGLGEVLGWVDSATPDTTYHLWPITIYVNADNEVMLRTVRGTNDPSINVHDIQFRSMGRTSNPAVI